MALGKRFILLIQKTFILLYDRVIINENLAWRFFFKVDSTIAVLNNDSIMVSQFQNNLIGAAKER